jgi:hypothetical protein
MSRGIGKTQQRILDELASIELPKPDWLLIVGGYLTVMQLAERLAISDRQIRRAVRAFEERGLVVINRGIAWHGIGEYGPLVQRDRTFSIGRDDLPTAKVIKAGEVWLPWNRPWGVRYRPRCDVELVHTGIPSPALEVWLREYRISYPQQDIAKLEVCAGRFKPGTKRHLAAERAEYERLTTDTGKDAS